MPTDNRGNTVGLRGDDREICKNNLDKAETNVFQQTGDGDLCGHGTNDSAKTIGIKLHGFVKGDPSDNHLLVAHFVLNVDGRHDQKIFVFQAC